LNASDETVLITGASSGIGLELARLFAADGSRLILVARNRERLEALAEELRKAHGAESLVLPQDLSDPRAPQALFDQLAAKKVEVDVLVNNAGFGALGCVARLALERQMEMIQVNIAALTSLTRLFLPGMMARNRGGILNVASTAAFQSGPNMAVYYASKAYVLSFTEALAEELSSTGIHVSCLAPGPTATEFGDRSGMTHSLVFRLGTMSARRVAELGYRGLRHRKTLVVAGIINRLGTLLVRFFPRFMIRKVIKRLQDVH
jgi:short-subunit dehydrogenase